MIHRALLAVLCAAALLHGPARASEDSVRRAFESKVPDTRVENVRPTPMTGVFEVVADGQIFYTDENVHFIFRGTLFDARSAKLVNLTSARSAELAAGLLAASTEGAIRRVRGNGRRVLYTFEDPNCGYCRKQQQELLKLDNVTIFTFLWPILSPDSVEKSKAVWCSRDRAKAWDDLMSRGVASRGDTTCETPIARNMELAQRFGARGTPAIFLADGRMLGGYVRSERIEEALRSLSK